MAALDFPSSPTVGQQYAAPNGITYQWDGAAWVVTGGPPATPTGPASGDLGGTYPGPSVLKVNGAALGVTTPLARGDVLAANATPALVRLALGAARTVLQSNGTDAVWAAVPPFLTRVRVARSTAQSCASGASTNISFDSLWGTDPSGMWSAGTPDRLTCKQTGFYVMGGNLSIDSSTGGARRLLSVIAGAAGSGVGFATTEAPQGASRGLAVAAAGALNLNDIIQLQVYHDAGVALSIGTAGSVGLWAVQVA